MAVYSKSQIDRWNHFLKEREYPKISVNLGNGRRFKYFLMDQKENPDLPDFAIAMRARNLSDGTIFGVSDSVPEELRKYWAAHEYMETVELAPKTPNKCLITLEKELSLVPDNLKAGYITRRRDFFENLVAYAVKKRYDETDVENFKASLNRLESLVLVS
ncbi:MAG TPA: hypothetical protein VI564_09465 [Candidatus Nanoarchaeia archaeon]|nr:hypothetical protein [Candidatus Nanoarchaeia archaeon]